MKIIKHTTMKKIFLVVLVNSEMSKCKDRTVLRIEKIIINNFI